MIYFIQAGDEQGAIKIGFTNQQICARVKQLQTGSPLPLRILCIMEGTTEKERDLHKRFKKFNIQGEWFRVSKEIIKYTNKIESIRDIQLLELEDMKKVEEQLVNGVLEDILAEKEKQIIQYIHKKTNYTTLRTAAVLGLTLRQLRWRFDKYKINSKKA